MRAAAVGGVVALLALVFSLTLVQAVFLGGLTGAMSWLLGRSGG